MARQIYDILNLTSLAQLLDEEKEVMRELEEKAAKITGQSVQVVKQLV